MNLTYKTLLLTVGLLGGSFVHASTAGVSLTNETVKGDVNLDMGSFGLNAGITNDIDTNSSTAHVGLTVQDSEGGNGPLEVGIGIRLYVVDTDVGSDDDEDLSAALSLGGWYRYTLQQANRVSIYGSLYYSPEVLSFSNLSHTYTYDFRLEYITMRNARAYISYANTILIYDDDTRKEINKGFSVGANVDF
ncbi:YfaZ family outer membrane protein [Marinomonas sp. GJ51-6]|uniref:YfaZ family outer membrane protein n=1 Tax=Marinomonas sp. GJ51-6 TaxID=2992802 RepID=UPI0029348B8D|nr:YfaZ family outer membrane protein [Marinomonas sp. GJ51-6]WOD07351.1 YfaZ family outer membrane protein [Marinomonas sp. GJ51-6]